MNKLNITLYLFLLSSIASYGMEQSINHAVISLSDPSQELAQQELLYKQTVIGCIAYCDVLGKKGIKRCAFVSSLNHDSLNMKSIIHQYVDLFIARSTPYCYRISFPHLDISDADSIPTHINIQDLNLGMCLPISLRRSIMYGNKTVGQISYEYNPRTNGARYITSLHVYTKMRNKGFGTHAMNLFIQESKEDGLKLLSLHTSKKAKPFYERFKFIAEKPGSNLMIKKLDD